MSGGREARGALSYLAGLHAEAAIAAHYDRRGADIAARRWRGRGGEIDLVAREGDTLVFIEVKRSRTHSDAAARIGARQIARLHAAAEEYIGTEPSGLDTAMRFDVALVDGQGRIDVLENAFG
jgi:putative endonuclease